MEEEEEEAAAEDLVNDWYHQIWVVPAAAGLAGMVLGLHLVERKMEAIVRFGLSLRKDIDGGNEALRLLSR